MDDSDGNTPFHVHFNYLFCFFVLSFSFSFLLVDKVIKGFEFLTFFFVDLKKIWCFALYEKINSKLIVLLNKL